MTSAFSPRPNSAQRKTNWLGRLLKVEKDYLNDLKPALNDAAKEVNNRILSLGEGTVSDRVKKVQMVLARQQIKSTISNLFGSIHGFVKNRKADSAEAAVNASIYEETSYLSSLIPDKVKRDQYITSLRQTSRRNIETLETRLAISKRPLSDRVYSTRALSKGLVDKAINNGLATGSSVEEIAKSVSDLIRPDVPGGVSYAAMRLGRTEINNAFHAQSIQDAQAPWIDQVRWNLSKAHKEDPGDLCEEYADIGLFSKYLIPHKPHPNCYCYLTMELMDFDTFEKILLIGQFDDYIDNIIANGGT